jgi:hypothetical protein
MTYQEIILSLSNSLLNKFDEVYHSAELITIQEDGKTYKFPAITLKDEWVILAPTDQQQILYIRRNGEDEVQSDLRLASCGKAYNMRSILRVVYFDDNAEKHNEILQHLMQSVLVSGIKLKSIIRDKVKLFKDESSGEYSFRPTTAYFALDVYALWNLKPDSCEEDFCIELDNPIKKCLTIETQS